MKTIFALFAILVSLSCLAAERTDLEQLLLERGTSIAAFEAQGMRLIMGERTGGGKNIVFASVEVVFTKEEAILKKEIVNVKLQNGVFLENLESIQSGGRHIQAEDIVGVITKK